MKIKWPFVSRKKFKQVEHRAFTAECQLAGRQRDLIELRDELTPKILRIAEKIFKTTWKRHRPPSQRYCLVIEFDPYIIQDGLIHGDNRQELDYIANYIGHMAVREIHQINFARYIDESEERKFRVPEFNSESFNKIP